LHHDHASARGDRFFSLELFEVGHDPSLTRALSWRTASASSWAASSFGVSAGRRFW